MVMAGKGPKKPTDGFGNDPEDEPPISIDSFIGEADKGNVMYMQFLEANGGKEINPLSKEGLELQAAYLKTLGDNSHPFDILRRISINPFAPLKDRISASKTLLEYMARKVPAAIEVTGADGQALMVSQSALRNLSAEDLENLSEILEKANKGVKNG